VCLAGGAARCAPVALEHGQLNGDCSGQPGSTCVYAGCVAGLTLTSAVGAATAQNKPNVTTYPLCRSCSGSGLFCESVADGFTVATAIASSCWPCASPGSSGGGPSSSWQCTDPARGKQCSASEGRRVCAGRRYPQCSSCATPTHSTSRLACELGGSPWGLQPPSTGGFDFLEGLVQVRCPPWIW
jgi:hypothetical protein